MHNIVVRHFLRTFFVFLALSAHFASKLAKSANIRKPHFKTSTRMNGVKYNLSAALLTNMQQFFLLENAYVLHTTELRCTIAELCCTHLSYAAPY